MENEAKFVCPACQSDNIQSFEVAFKNGISTTSTTTTGIGVAKGLGVGMAKSTSTNMNAMAEETAPPAKYGYVKRFILVWLISYVTVGLLLSQISDTLGGIVAFAIPAFDAYRRYKWNRDEYPKLMETWSHAYICLRCGNKFTL